MEMIVINTGRAWIVKKLSKYFEHWPAMFFGAVVSLIFLVVIFSYQVKSTEIAAKYYSVFKENPELAFFLRKLDSLNRMNSGKLTLILKTDASPFDVMNGTENAYRQKALPWK